MKSLENEVMNCFEPLAREIGAKITRDVYGDYIDIHGKGMVLRVYWRIERTEGAFANIYKEVMIGKRPREYSLGYLILFKDDSIAKYHEVGRSEICKIQMLVDDVRKYAMGYLLGMETDFQKFEEYANIESKREIKEHYPWLEEIKNNKLLRPEWIPEEID